MKRLYISIVISVITALFLINWGVDKLAESYTQTVTENNETNELVLYKKLIQGIVEELSATVHGLDPSKSNAESMEVLLKQKVALLAQEYQLTIILEEASNLALPPSLQKQLTQTGALLLSSGHNSYLLKKLPNQPNWLVRLQMLKQEELPHSNLLLTSLLYLGVCSLLVLWLLPLTHRLYLLTQTAANIGDGHLTARLPSSKFSYINQFETNFNKMAAQIETLVTDNKMLARSLSHDIRTPLACLRFGIEAALDCQDMDKKNHYINKMDAEITRMENMTAAFLTYASLERKSLSLNKKKQNINLLIKTLTEDFTPLAHKNKLTINTELPETDVKIEVDSHWCYLAIQNLVGNAIQYAEHKVLISLHQNNENSITISIDDDGKGIPEEDVHQIFKPFVKLSNSSREQENFGLGLATTAKVMEWHHGSITAKPSIKLSGLSCQITFPF